MDKSEFQRTFQRSDELVIDWEVKGSEHLGKICLHWHICSLGFQILMSYYPFLATVLL